MKYPLQSFLMARRAMHADGFIAQTLRGYLARVSSEARDTRGTRYRGTSSADAISAHLQRRSVARAIKA